MQKSPPTHTHTLQLWSLGCSAFEPFERIRRILNRVAKENSNASALYVVRMARCTVRAKKKKGKRHLSSFVKR